MPRFAFIVPGDEGLLAAARLLSGGPQESFGVSAVTDEGVTTLSVEGSAALLRWVTTELPGTAQEIADLETYLGGI